MVIFAQMVSWLSLLICNNGYFCADVITVIFGSDVIIVFLLRYHHSYFAQIVIMAHFAQM